MLQQTTTAIATDGSGDATVYLGSKMRGLLLALKYTPGSIETGADITITGETSGIPILTKENAGTSDVFFYPRALANAVADGAAGTNSQEYIPLAEERIKVVVANGGDSKEGSITAVWESSD